RGSMPTTNDFIRVMQAQSRKQGSLSLKALQNPIAEVAADNLELVGFDPELFDIQIARDPHSRHPGLRSCLRTRLERACRVGRWGGLPHDALDEGSRVHNRNIPKRVEGQQIGIAGDDEIGTAVHGEFQELSSVGSRHAAIRALMTTNS